MSKKGQNGQEGVDASKKGTNSRPNGVGASKNGRFGESWGRCVQKRDALRPVQNQGKKGRVGLVRPKRDASRHEGVGMSKNGA